MMVSVIVSKIDRMGKFICLLDFLKKKMGRYAGDNDKISPGALQGAASLHKDGHRWFPLTDDSCSAIRNFGIGINDHSKMFLIGFCRSVFDDPREAVQRRLRSHTTQYTDDFFFHIFFTTEITEHAEKNIRIGFAIFSDLQFAALSCRGEAIKSGDRSSPERRRVLITQSFFLLPYA